MRSSSNDDKKFITSENIEGETRRKIIRYRQTSAITCRMACSRPSQCPAHRVPAPLSMLSQPYPTTSAPTLFYAFCRLDVQTRYPPDSQATSCPQNLIYPAPLHRSLHCCGEKQASRLFAYSVERLGLTRLDMFYTMARTSAELHYTADIRSCATTRYRSDNTVWQHSAPSLSAYTGSRSELAAK